MRLLWFIINRIITIGIAAAICLWLTVRLGPWTAICVWAGGMAAACCLVAFLMHRQPAGRVTIVNRLAYRFMPWGYRVGQGKLPAIVAVSWFVWMLIGGAVVSLTVNHQAASAHVAIDPGAGKSFVGTGAGHATVLALIFFFWLVDGAVLGRFFWALNNMYRSHGRLTNSSVLGPIGILLVMLVLSAWLTVFTSSPGMLLAALLIAGGPTLLVGGSYGLFVLVMVTVGRKARWN